MNDREKGFEWGYQLVCGYLCICRVNAELDGKDESSAIFKKRISKAMKRKMALKSTILKDESIQGFYDIIATTMYMLLQMIDMNEYDLYGALKDKSKHCNTPLEMFSEMGYPLEEGKDY